VGLTVVREAPSRIERVLEGLALLERARVEYALHVGRDRVRRHVLIDPADGRSHRDGQRVRVVPKVDDVDQNRVRIAVRRRWADGCPTDRGRTSDEHTNRYGKRQCG
jgi:hypothetical protein